MSSCTMYLVHSLEKVFPFHPPIPLNRPCLTGFCGETLSLQLAYTSPAEAVFSLRVISEISVAISIRRVELVPCDYPCHAVWDEDYLATEPGVYPDLLLPMGSGEAIRAVPGQWRSLWIDVEAQPGIYAVTLEAVDARGAELAAVSFSVGVLPVELPAQRLMHSQWFHADCLADYYDVPVFSEEHWRIIDHFLSSAAHHGVNTILTPIFTPPLDTAPGGERTTVQLVKIYRNQGAYSFDFSRLKRWLELCEKNGIRYLEMAHLFSQWGAAYAPKILVSLEGGEEVRQFGWHTSATDPSYTEFLHAFLPALKGFLREQGWLERTIFHISDEPNEQVAKTYGEARASVRDVLEDCRVMDALSSFELYRQGLVSHPIVSVDRLEPFLEAGVPHLWAYYCTAQSIDVPNRFISMPSWRNRILGVLLYYFQIEGFLHWGFNFYNSQGSVKHIDPYRVTDAGGAFPSGDPFLVYPAPDGTAYESIRGMVLRQGLYDIRALTYLEERVGREAVRGLLEKLAGGGLSFRHYPRGTAFFDTMREALYRQIESKTLKEDQLGAWRYLE